jgi:hypothetical protein
MPSPLLGLPVWTEGQALPATKGNEIVAYLEFLGAGGPIIDRDLTAPPGSPVNGDAYLVPTGASGVWAANEGKIALRVAGAWAYITPIEGMMLRVKDENLRIEYDGAAWSTFGAGYTDEQVRDAVGAALVEGTGIDVTVNDGSDTITLAVTVTYDDEQARDALGTAFVAGDGIDKVVDDGANTITISTEVQHVTVADQAAYDAIGAPDADTFYYIPE